MTDTASPDAALALIGGALATGQAAGSSLSVPLPFQEPIVLMEDVRIAGTTHIHGIAAIAARLDMGAQLTLEREPDNIADRWAIRVLAGGQRIGYVPADCNEVLARMMDGGKALSAKLVDKDELGGWTRLYMEVSLDD